MKKRYSLFIISVSACIGLILLSAYSQEEVVYAEDYSEHFTSTPEKELDMNHSTVVNKMNGLMDTLIQDVDNNYKVQAYDTREGLQQAFEQHTSQSLAEQFVDYYFIEKSDGMYIIPMESPSWFQEENDYDMIKKDENTIQLIQDNYNEMVGEYTLVVDFTFQQDWKISGVTYQ